MPAPFSGRRNVIALGAVSLLNDLASEMVYPLVPIFLTATLGAPVAAVGIIEGVAESTAGVLKAASGWLSDRIRRRKVFAAGGYALSALAKLALAFAATWTLVLAARFADRFGKGVRTPARDALIADSTDVADRGRAFGLHRAMDTLGAIAGPLVALAVLSLSGSDMRTVFALAAVPGFLGVALLVAVVRDPVRAAPARAPITAPGLRVLGAPFMAFLAASVVFSIGNSSDMFLILRARGFGYSAAETVVLYVVFNAAYSLLSLPFGRLADRIGDRAVLAASFAVFAVVYAGMAIAPRGAWMWVLFPAYGLFMAMNEGVGKSHITRIVPADRRATAIGSYYAATGVASLAASAIAGLMWSAVSPSAVFWYGAACAVAAGAAFLLADPMRARPASGGSTS